MAWKDAVLASQSVIPNNNFKFNQAFRVLLESRFESPLIPVVSTSIISRDILLEGLSSLVTEWIDGDCGAAFGAPSLTVVATGLVNFHKLWIRDPEPDYTVLIRWHVIFSTLLQTMGRAAVNATERKTTLWIDEPFHRRALLHANEVRQIAEDYSIPIGRVPPIGLPICLYDAGKTMNRFIRSLKPTENIPQTSYPLRANVDWQSLGIHPFPDLSRHEDSPPPSAASDATWQYISYGGTPTIHERPFGTQHLFPFTLLLNAFGNSWPRSTNMAHELESPSN